MNPKIAKLREEHEKNRAKIAELQARDRELMRQLRELENTEIIGLVRSQGLKLEEFAAMMQGRDPASIINQCVDKEDIPNADEE